MTKVIWDESGSREYFAGVDRGVLYPVIGSGVPWNGLVSVNELEESNLVVNHVDGIAFRQSSGGDSFSATLRAFTYPDEFNECNGFADGLIAQQPRVPFGLSYRTLIGNDLEGLDLGYKIHLVYNALVAPTPGEYETIADSVETSLFEWPITTTPLAISGVGPSAHLIIDSTIAYPEVISELEDVLYGTPTTEPHLPTPTEILAIFESNSILLITDNGDGTWTATAPGDIIEMLDSTTFEITWPSAIFIDDESYTISSL